jgi:alginate O-acetyltransferase complex protein AlgI
MSLSKWFRDYLYIPLGGNRVSSGRVYLNLLIVFLVTGFWHGAAWTFVAWGLFHGVFLMAERLTGVARWTDQRWPMIRRPVTLVVIMLSWVIFRSPNIADCAQFGRALLGARNKWAFPVKMTNLMDVQTFLAFGLGLLAFVSQRSTTAGLFLDGDSKRSAWARAAVVLVLLPVVISQVMASDYSPFLYFQF